MAAQVQELGFGMYEGGEIDISKDRLLMTRVVSWGIVDENHNLLFTEADVAELGKKSYAATERVATKILNMSGLGSEETTEGNE